MAFHKTEAGSDLWEKLEEARQRIQPWYYDPLLYSLQHIASLSGICDIFDTKNPGLFQRR